MFDRFDVRYRILLIWLLSFIALWTTFQITFPLTAMEKQLDIIEKNIEDKNWSQASEHTREFKDNFAKNRIFIQMNNSTEALTTFEHTIGQLELTVKHKQESALEYVGALKESTNLVIKPFSGP